MDAGSCPSCGLVAPRDHGLRRRRDISSASDNEGGQHVAAVAEIAETGVAGVLDAGEVGMPRGRDDDVCTAGDGARGDGDRDACGEEKRVGVNGKLEPGGGDGEEQVMFSCNICYELASEPVVTLCGHLYCWPCLYRWLQVQNHCRTCPVCKAGVDRDKVIPVYGRGGNEDPRAKTIETSNVVPVRPTGQRPQPVDTRTLLQGNLGGQQNLLPNLFGLSGAQQQLSPEQQHQAFLSRLLLMLGSFVIMCRT